MEIGGKLYIKKKNLPFLVIMFRYKESNMDITDYC